MEKSLRREYWMALMIVVISAVACLIYWRSALENQDRLIADTRQTVERRAVQLNAAVSQEVDVMVRQIDLATQYLRDAYVNQHAFDATVHLVLNSFPAGALQFITVFNEQGTLAYSSNGLTDATEKLYFGDREHFRVHADRQEDRLFISKPTIGRLTGVWLVQFTRPIRRDGRLLGVIAIPVRPDYWSKTLAGALLNPHDVISIVRSDGSFITRTRHLEEAFQTQLPADRPFLQAQPGTSGAFRAVSAVDRVPMIFAWRRLEQWPLITVVGLDETAELAPVYAQMATERQHELIATGLLMAFALGLAFLLLRIGREKIELLNSQRRYQVLLRTASDGIHILDADGNLREASDSFRRMLGYTEVPPAPRNVAEWGAGFAPSELIPKVRELICSPVPVQFETQHRRLDGSRIDVEINASGVELDGQRFLYASSRDISERKQLAEQLRENQEKLQAIYDVLPVGITVTDPEGNIIDCNQASEALLGISQEEHLARNHADKEWTIRRPDGHPMPPDEYASVRALQTGEAVRDVEMEVVTPTHSQWLLVSAIPLHNRRYGVVIAYVDINEHKRIEAELRRSNTELEQFAYAASHDLRQPLRMIASYLQLLEQELRETLNDECRQYLNFVTDGAKRIDQMLMALLDYSRVGRKGAAKTWIETRDSLDEALLFLRPAIAEAGATIQINGEWPRLYASRDELTRLFQNLIGNAVKYRAEGQAPELAVMAEQAGSEWRVTVRDNGIGIAPGQIGRLFQVFQRLQARAKYEGVGVGLALCRKIVEHHGGRIWAESAGDGQGCVFRFTLPVSGEPRP
jgi:PAS domain S-box-containing protein